MLALTTADAVFKVHSRYVDANTARRSTALLTNLYTIPTMPDMKDGLPHEILIVYSPAQSSNNGVLKVYMDEALITAVQVDDDQLMEITLDQEGSISEIHCEYDPESRSGLPGASRKVKGTIHWVSVEHGVNAEVRLYDRLFSVPNPLADKEKDYLEFLNPHSLDIVSGAFVEPVVAAGQAGDFFQFERWTSLLKLDFISIRNQSSDI